LSAVKQRSHRDATKLIGFEVAHKPNFSDIPVEHSVLDRLADVHGAYDFGGLEIGNCSGHLEDAGVGAGREAEFFEGGFEQRLGIFVTRKGVSSPFPSG